MTDTEMIEAVERGERIHTGTSLHAEEKPNPFCRHDWRAIACDFERDVVECRHCGQQKTVACIFDDDFA